MAEGDKKTLPHRTQTILLIVVVVVSIFVASLLYWKAALAPTVDPGDIASVTVPQTNQQTEYPSEVDPADLQQYGFWIPSMEAGVEEITQKDSKEYHFANENSAFVSTIPMNSESIGTTQTEDFTTSQGFAGTEMTESSEKDGSSIRIVTIEKDQWFYRFRGTDEFLDEVKANIQFDTEK